MTKTTDKTTENAKTVHTNAMQAVREWTRNLHQAKEELARLTDAPATDAEAVRQRAAKTAIAREYIVQCEHALEEAIERSYNTARALVADEARALEPQLSTARAQLTEHDATTDVLLEKLRQHTGQDWAVVDQFKAQRDRGTTGPISVPVPTRDRLLRPVMALERQQSALLAAARGEDPITICEPGELPDSLKPGGALPSPTLVERQAYADQLAAEQAEIDAQLAESQAQVDTAYRALDLEPAAEATHTLGDGWAVQRGRDWGARFAGIMSGRGLPLPGHDLQAQSANLAALETIAALAGWDAGDEAANALQRRHNPAQGPDAA